MIELITASKVHLPEIKRIAYETWPATFGAILSEKQIAYMLDWMYSIPSLTSQIDEKGHVFILAQEGDEYLGYVSYELNYSGLPKTKIHKIYLLPASQGKGVGALLIDRVGEIATENQNKALLLNVNRYNKAVGFYEKMGFNIVGNETIDIGDGFLMEDFMMEKPL
ncbi:GNAT family N-acetyltransferase [Runella aurantiaca]|uniref:GNAT family N-acetyltransferase n=1 Tax=Runella aurantiaca TaxID=2282308 RepID=UPI0018F6E48F|nr:GNAT family N-acetyltransferase [Runella aurantiaca]